MQGLFIKKYHYIDDQSFIKPAEIFLAEKGLNHQEIESEIEGIKNIFKKHGWEGDGKIGIIWLPPFLADDNSTGSFIWHVKQSNNGTSFIASPIKIPFGFLGNNAQDDVFSGMLDLTYKYISILGDFKNDIIEENNYLCGLEISNIKSRILNKSFFANHDKVVSMFIHMIETFYLDMLQERYLYHNDKIKISKRRIDIDHSMADLEYRQLKQYEKLFHNQTGLISSIWESYKNVGIKDKLKDLFRAVAFNMDEKALDIIFLHIELRNCIQHNDGVFWRKEHLRQPKKIFLLASGREIKLKDTITFINSDLTNLIDLIRNFLEEFINHVREYLFITDVN